MCGVYVCVYRCECFLNLLGIREIVLIEDINKMYAFKYYNLLNKIAKYI